MVATLFSSKVARFAVAGCNALTWISSVIVVGITGYFLNDYPHDQHLIFEMVIVSEILLYVSTFSKIEHRAQY